MMVGVTALDQAVRLLQFSDWLLVVSVCGALFTLIHNIGKKQGREEILLKLMRSRERNKELEEELEEQKEFVQMYEDLFFQLLEERKSS